MSRKIEDTEELKLRFLETKKRLADNLRQLGKEFESDFAESIDKASSRVELGVERVSSQVVHAVTSTVDTVHAGIEETVDRFKTRLDVRRAVRAHPWRNLGWSVAAGFGVALLLGTRKRPVALPEPAADKAEPVTAKSERAAPVGLLAGLLAPTLVQLARAGAGQLLENLVETSLRRAHEGLEAHSVRYAKAAEAVRHRAAGAREDLH